MKHVPCTLADPDPDPDPDLYRPIEEPTRAGPRYRLAGLPADLIHSDSGVRTMCTPPEGYGATPGWKVHISATFLRAQQVPGEGAPPTRPPSGHRAAMTDGYAYIDGSIGQL